MPHYPPRSPLPKKENLLTQKKKKATGQWPPESGKLTLRLFFFFGGGEGGLSRTHVMVILLYKYIIIFKGVRGLFEEQVK